MKKCIANDIKFGFDSCSGRKFHRYCSDNDEMRLMKYATFCESTLQSFYINVDGTGFPCSFTEGENVWKEGIDITKIDDFVKDVWYNKKIESFRNKLCNGCGNCPTFKI